MLRHAIVVCFAAILSASPVLAETLVLQPSQAFSGEYDRAVDMAHMLQMDAPGEMEDAFLTEVSFMARTYGDVSGIYGSVVVYRPAEDENSFPETGETVDGLAEIMATYVFPLSDVGESGGWFTAPFEPFPVSTEYIIAVYAYSTDDHGLEVGVSETLGTESESGWFVMTRESDEEARTLTTMQTIRVRADSRAWMAQASFTDTVESGHAVDATAIAGPNFIVTDDGSAEGFITTQRYGPMLHVVAEGPQVLESVYIYGKLEGDWFESDHKGALYLMDKDYRLISTKRIPYYLFTNKEAWTEIVIGTGVKVPAEFYVLIEPNARPKVELLVGYDASSSNLASEFGTMGSKLDWETEAPEESTNWMIRLHFK